MKFNEQARRYSQRAQTAFRNGHANEPRKHILRLPASFRSIHSESGVEYPVRLFAL
jgi:hypothetical protein